VWSVIISPSTAEEPETQRRWRSTLQPRLNLGLLTWFPGTKQGSFYSELLPDLQYRCHVSKNRDPLRKKSAWQVGNRSSNLPLCCRPMHWESSETKRCQVVRGLWAPFGFCGRQMGWTGSDLSVNRRRYRSMAHTSPLGWVRKPECRRGWAGRAWWGCMQNVPPIRRPLMCYNTPPHYCLIWALGRL
jgi:hypothetical protein